MSEMGDWFAQLGSQGAFTIPEQGGGVRPIQAPPPGEDTTRTQPTQPTPTAPDQTRTPDAAAPPPPEAGAPAISAPLRIYLMQQLSGHNVMSPEMYNFYGGDEILRQVQKYDPNARWTASEIGGGEGGSMGSGMRLDFDPRLIPNLQTPAGAPEGITWRPVYDNEGLRVQEMQYNDPLYGPMTPLQNKYKTQDPWWTYAAPLAIGALAPMAAPAFFGALGAGAAGAGFTSAVTGAAAGLGAGSIPGVLGAGTFAGASPWWATQGVKSVPNIGRIGSGLMAGGAGGSATPGPVHSSTGDYNPMAYNNAGSVAKPNTNDSSLVATQFADDPYGMSRGRG